MWLTVSVCSFRDEILPHFLFNFIWGALQGQRTDTQRQEMNGTEVHEVKGRKNK